MAKRNHSRTDQGYRMSSHRHDERRQRNAESINVIVFAVGLLAIGFLWIAWRIVAWKAGPQAAKLAVPDPKRGKG